MYLALTDLFRPKWTDEVHEEWIGAVLEDREDLNRKQLERTRDLMNAHVRDALITDYEGLIETLKLPDPDDRHVLAAAIKGRCDLIVTLNLKDFPPEMTEPFGIEAQHPDDFINHLIDLSPATIAGAAKIHRNSLKNPPKNVQEYLDTLEAQGLVQSVAELRKFSGLI